MNNRIWIGQDPELVLVKYLKACRELRGVRVGTMKDPLDKTTKTFVQVRQTGGSQRDLVTDLFQVTVICWTEKTTEAMRLGRIVRGLIEAAAEAGDMAGVPCYTAAPIGVTYPDPDPVSGSARATTTFQIALRGAYK